MIYGLSDNDLVLFQGDSITDADRNREDLYSLGHGYAGLSAALFSASHPLKRLRWINKGIGGDTAPGLEKRWSADCLDLDPKLISIMIGINDAHANVDIATFEKSYRNILARSREKLDAEILLIEPFYLPVSDMYAQIRANLWPEIEVVRSLAREFSCGLLALDGLFAEVYMMQEPAYWAVDGVHPTPVAHALLAEAWLQAVGVE